MLVKWRVLLPGFLAISSFSTLAATVKNDSPTLEKELYGYLAENLFLHFICGRPTHLMLAYPRGDVPTDDLPPRDFELEIGQNLLNQFAIPPLIHLVLDKYSCSALPIQGLQSVPFYPAHYVLFPKYADRFGGVTLELWNIRIHKARMASYAKDYPTKDKRVRVVQNYFGGKIEDDRDKLILSFVEERLNFTNEPLDFFDSDPSKPPSTDYVMSPSIVFIDKDHLRVAVKGLNLVVTTNYEVSGSQGLISDMNQVGELWARITDSAIFFDIDLREHRKNRRPMAVVPRKPEMFIGGMKFKFSGNFGDIMVSYLTNSFQNTIADYFELMLAKILQQEMPRISQLVYDVVEHTVISNLDEKLGQYDLEPSTWPRLAVEDLRWSVQDYKIKVGGFIRHIPSTERDLMVERQEYWARDSKNSVKIEKCRSDKNRVGKLGVTPSADQDLFKIEYSRPYSSYSPLDESSGQCSLQPEEPEP